MTTSNNKFKPIISLFLRFSFHWKDIKVDETKPVGAHADEFDSGLSLKT